MNVNTTPVSECTTTHYIGTVVGPPAGINNKNTPIYYILFYIQNIQFFLYIKMYTCIKLNNQT